jgi:hypothetical protein
MRKLTQQNKTKHRRFLFVAAKVLFAAVAPDTATYLAAFFTT